MVDFAVFPDRTALIQVDMQNCFVEGYTISVLEGLVILDRINRLSETQVSRKPEDRHPMQPKRLAHVGHWTPEISDQREFRTTGNARP